MTRYKEGQRVANYAGDFFLVWWDGAAYYADARQVTGNCLKGLHDKAVPVNPPGADMHKGGYCVTRCCCPCHGDAVPEKLKQVSGDVVRVWSALLLDELEEE